MLGAIGFRSTLVRLGIEEDIRMQLFDIQILTRLEIIRCVKGIALGLKEILHALLHVTAVFLLVCGNQERDDDRMETRILLKQFEETVVFPHGHVHREEDHRYPVLPTDAPENPRLAEAVVPERKQQALEFLLQFLHFRTILS